MHKGELENKCLEMLEAGEASKSAGEGKDSGRLKREGKGKGKEKSQGDRKWSPPSCRSWQYVRNTGCLLIVYIVCFEILRMKTWHKET